MIIVSKNSTPNVVPYINGNGADFKSLSISHQSKPIAISFRKTKLIEKEKTPTSFEIKFSEFDSRFKMEIIELKITGIEDISSSNEMILRLKFNQNIIKAVLSGYWKEKEGFYTQGFGLAVEQKGETPASVFLLSTLWAMFGLSSQFKVQLPTFNYEFTTSFGSPLNEISKQLRTRQIAYRAMVIEQALKVKLTYSNDFIEGEDVGSITFCYQAIVEREFDSIYKSKIVPLIASEEYLSLLPNENKPFPLNYAPECFTKNIFGYELELGLMEGQIENAVLDNFEEAKEKLSKLDGSEVLVYLRSLNGMIRFKSVNVPTLPKNAFSREIQKLIDLEEKLDSMFFDKYLNSFSDAFEGLTDEQIQAITERPTLEEEAFNF